MVNKANTAGKRKNEFNDIKAEPALKAMKKQDLTIQFKVLQDKNEALVKKNMILEAQNKTHIESILLLEETVAILEKRSVHKTTIGSQTEIIRCEECEYPAECMNDLVYHMFEFHPLTEKEPSIKCNHCENTFTSKRDLMVHKKREHAEKVQLCINISNGECIYGNGCWFKHDDISLPVYNCNLCDKTFRTKSEFMKHKKNDHAENVAKCENNKDGTCRFSSTSCWFHHENDQNKSKILSDSNMENSSIIKRLMDMVENYTERTIKLESEMKKILE